MKPVVSVQDVVNELDILMNEHTAYFNRKTGEIISLGDDDVRMVEDEEEPANLPEWQAELLTKFREVLDSEDYLALPTRFDIDEYSIMEQFCGDVENSNWRDELFHAIKGKGAFRYFKDTIHRLGIQEDWYRFRKEALEQIATEWLEGNQINFRP